MSNKPFKLHRDTSPGEGDIENRARKRSDGVRKEGQQAG